MSRATDRTQHVKLRVSPSELTRIRREASRRNLTVSSYARLVLAGEAQRMDDLAGYVAQRVAGNVGLSTQEALQRMIEDAWAEHADRLINALAVGLGTAMATVTGRPINDDLVDQLADQMRDAYEYQRDSVDGGTGDTDERTS